MKRPKRTFKQNRIFTQNNPLSPRICPELASEIGLDKSILLLQYEFWIATEGEERNGQLWIRKTVREIKQVFSFWSTSTINRIINKLVSDGYMIADALDEGDQKNGRWLCFGFEKLGSLKSIKIICAETGQTFVPERDGICANLRQTISQTETNNENSPYTDTKSKEEEYKKEQTPLDFVFDFYKTHLGHARTVLTDERRKLIARRLRDYSADDLCAAIRGCKLSAFHQGENDRSTVYDSIELIFKDAQHVEGFIARAELGSSGNGNGKPRTQSERNLANLKGSLALFQGRGREDNSQEPTDIIATDARTIGKPVTR